MKQRLAVLIACAALFAAACSESKPPLAAAQPAPVPAPAPERVEPSLSAKLEAPPPEKKDAVASGEEVKSDAAQIAAFEKRVLK
jgi:hypothetical protein